MAQGTVGWLAGLFIRVIRSFLCSFWHSAVWFTSDVLVLPASAVLALIVAYAAVKTEYLSTLYVRRPDRPASAEQPIAPPPSLPLGFLAAELPPSLLAYTR